MCWFRLWQGPFLPVNRLTGSGLGGIYFGHVLAKGILEDPNLRGC